jgi:hypothetical protein
MWCHLDAIPAPDVEELDGAPSFLRLAPVSIVVILSLAPPPPFCLVESRPKLAFSLLDGTFDENERLVSPQRLLSSATRGLLSSFISFFFIFVAAAPHPSPMR